jgi:hypothetical protein
MGWQRLTCTALGVLALLSLAACGGGNADWSHLPPPDDGQRWKDAYIPYVEEVIFPDQIYADEQFTVRVRLSAELLPALLDGHSYVRSIGPSNLGLFLWAFANDAGSAAPALEPELAVEAGPWAAGPHQFFVDSAVSRERGGAKAQFGIAGSLGPVATADWEARPYTLTVVERPGPT